MKVVLFCGGLGMRLREFTDTLPKPMVPVDQRPILWHVMSTYSRYGHHDFVLCLGYKSGTIKDYFLEHRMDTYGNIRVRGNDRRVEVIGESPPSWNIGLFETGLQRNIGERLLAVRDEVDREEIFLANYADGLTDAPLDEMLEFFKKSGKVACFLAVQPQFSYHMIETDSEGGVRGFRTGTESELWINGGYFFFRREIFDYIKPGEELVVEPFQRLIEANQLLTYRYRGFWASMDTLKDKQTLEEMADRGHLPWLGRHAGG